MISFGDLNLEILLILGYYDIHKQLHFYAKLSLACFFYNLGAGLVFLAQCAIRLIRFFLIKYCYNCI